MKALIFDMDGTLVDSEKVHRKAFLKALDELKINYNYDEVFDFMIKGQGIPDDVFVNNFIKKFKLDISIEEIINLKKQIYFKLIESDVEAFPGAVDFVKSFYGKYKLAIATSSSVKDMDTVLKKIGLYDVFDQKISGAKLENPKPAPDIFLLASEKLSLDIKDCLIFEDSTNGLLAAKKSGGKVIAFDYRENETYSVKKYFTIHDYRSFNRKAIEEIFNTL